MTGEHHDTHPPDRPRPGARPRAARFSRLTSDLLTALTIAVAVLLWPATWGGLLGLTIVSGHSMEPTHVTGDLVITWPASTYDVGDVIVYEVPAGQPGAGGHVVHRVVETTTSSGASGYVTRGDNNPSIDIWTPTDDDVLGREVAAVRRAGLLLVGARNPLLLAAAASLLLTIALWPRHAADATDPRTSAYDRAPAR